MLKSSFCIDLRSEINGVVQRVVLVSDVAEQPLFLPVSRANDFGFTQ